MGGKCIVVRETDDFVPQFTIVCQHSFGVVWTFVYPFVNLCVGVKDTPFPSNSRIVVGIGVVNFLSGEMCRGAEIVDR